MRQIWRYIKRLCVLIKIGRCDMNDYFDAVNNGVIIFALIFIPTMFFVLWGGYEY